MLILELTNGTTLEIPGARRLRRADGEILCEDGLGQVLKRVDEETVVNYAIGPDPKATTRRSRKLA